MIKKRIWHEESVRKKGMRWERQVRRGGVLRREAREQGGRGSKIPIWNNRPL